jgi:hypothetical protein
VNSVQVCLLLEAIGFGSAALVHAGVLAYGYEHRAAMTAEGVIATVLVLGLVVSAIAPALTRVSGLGVQAFALFGTAVGIVMIMIGVGPQTGFDVALHAGFVTLLVIGLIITARYHAPRRV